MILKIGVPDYPYRAMKDIAGAKIRGRMKGRDIPLILVAMDDMAGKHEKLPNLRGIPTCVAFDFKKQRIWLHPNPDGEYDLEVDRGEEKQPEKSGNTLTLPKK